MEQPLLEKRPWKEDVEAAAEEEEELTLERRQYRKIDVDEDLVVDAFPVAINGSKPGASEGIESQASDVAHGGELAADFTGIAPEAFAATNGGKPVSDYAGIVLEASAGTDNGGELAADSTPEASAGTDSGGELAADSTGIVPEASAVTNGGEIVANHTGIESQVSSEEGGKPQAENGEEKSELQNCNGGEVEENGGGHGFRSSVYLDKVKGTWKCRHCDWTHHVGSPSVVDVHNPKGVFHMVISEHLNQRGPSLNLETKGLGSTNRVSEIQSEKIAITGSSNLYGEDLKNAYVSGISSSPHETLFKTSEAGLKDFDQESDRNRDEDVDFVDEIEESTDLDVEGVLKKQNTHDLYCPICHSCITRKVILRRRKPKIRRKRRPERKLDDNPTNAGDGSRDIVDISSNISPTPAPASAEQNNDGERDAFRCLSCLSFFIPTGEGFRIFQGFGEGKKNENRQTPETMPPGKTNWFFSIFAPQGEKAALDQGPSLSEVSTTNQHVQSRSPDNLSASNQHYQMGASIDNRTPADHGESANPPKDLNAEAETVFEALSDQNGFLLVKGGSIPAESDKGNQVHEVNGTQTSGKDISSSSTDIPIFIAVGDNSVGEVIDDYIVKSGSTPSEPFGRGGKVYDQITGPQKSGKDVVNSSTAILILSAVAEKSDVGMINDNIVEDGSAPTEPFGRGGKIYGVTGPQNSGKDISNNSSKEIAIAINIGEKPIGAVIEKNIGFPLPEEAKTETAAKFGDGFMQTEIGDYVMIVVEPQSVETADCQRAETTIVSREVGAIESRGLDILKSIVYGGLIEAITSLGVVSSAAGAGAATLNILVLGLANLIGGLFMIIHNLRELKKDQSGVVSSETNTQEDRYYELLGRRNNFALHATVSILSYLIFGLIPPVVYAFAFRESDNRDYKLAAIAGASLVCIILLALGKAHVGKPPRTYFKTMFYYVIIGFMASGASYLVGELLKKLLEELGWFDSSSAVAMPLLEAKPLERAWAYYRSSRINFLIN